VSGHTPGPWVWVDPLKVLNAAHSKIFDHAAYEGMWFAAYDKKVDEANARLIAAAPELLEALTAAMDFIESHVAGPDISAEMVRTYAALQSTNPRAAIAKATQP
jgi:hypothetical protein